jgi:hypothetical protein
MSDQNSIRDDISYMRQLAESGRKGPILGGIFLAAAGIVFGGTCVVSWAMHAGLLPFASGWTDLGLWLGAFAVFAVIWIVMFLRLQRHGQKAASAPNATFGIIWSACGVGVMVAFGTTILVSNDLHASIVLNAYIPVIYAFYGTAWFASGALAKRTWMYFAGAGSWLYAFAIAMLAENPLQTVAMGLGLVLLLTIPGLKLMGEARQ